MLISKMNLVRRFQRLTFWNQLGAIGSVASVGSVALATFVWLIHQTVRIPSVNVDMEQSLRRRERQPDVQTHVLARTTAAASDPRTTPSHSDAAADEGSPEEQERSERSPTLLRLIQGDADTVVIASFEAARESTYQPETDPFTFGSFAFKGWSPAGNQHIAMHLLSECLRWDSGRRAWAPDKRRLKGLYKRVESYIGDEDERAFAKASIERLNGSFANGVDILTRTASPIFDIVFKNTDNQPHVLHSISVELFESYVQQGDNAGSVPVGAIIPIADEVTLTTPDGCEDVSEHKHLEACAIRSQSVEPMLLPANGVLRLKLVLLMPGYEEGEYAFGLRFHIDDRTPVQRVRFAVSVVG